MFAQFNGRHWILGAMVCFTLKLSFIKVESLSLLRVCEPCILFKFLAHATLSGGERIFTSRYMKALPPRKATNHHHPCREGFCTAGNVCVGSVKKKKSLPLGICFAAFACVCSKSNLGAKTVAHYHLNRCFVFSALWVYQKECAVLTCTVTDSRNEADTTCPYRIRSRDPWLFWLKGKVCWAAQGSPLWHIILP